MSVDTSSLVSTQLESFEEQQSSRNRNLDLLTILSHDSQKQVRKYIGNETVVEVVEKPSFWIGNASLIGVCIIGTILLIILAILQYLQSGK